MNHQSTMHVHLVKKVTKVHKYNWLERYILRRVHPRRIFIDAAGLVWATYFLWNQAWIPALLTVLMASLLGILSVWNVSPEEMAKTKLGKIGLLHLHPVNITVQSLSMVPLIVGIWAHSPEYICLGLSLLFLGHTVGWEEVDGHFSNE